MNNSSHHLAAGVIIIENDQVLMVRDAQGWCLPKGSSEVGEPLFQTAIREAKEETGFDVILTGVAFVTEYHTEQLGQYLQVYYEAKIQGGIMCASDPQEISELQFVPIDQVQKYMRFRAWILPLKTWLRDRKMAYHHFDLDQEGFEVRERAQAIVIQNQKMLFGYGLVKNEPRHFFIGGGIEFGETPSEAVLRELREEANVNGKIIFEFTSEFNSDHHTFFVEIGDAQVTLGHDPEESPLLRDARSLQGLIWMDLKDKHLFTDLDKKYLALLYKECVRNNYLPSWLNLIKYLLDDHLYDHRLE